MRSENASHSAQAEGGQKARAKDAGEQLPQHKDDADSPEGAKLRPADLTVSFMKVSIPMECIHAQASVLVGTACRIELCISLGRAPCAFPLSDSSASDLSETTLWQPLNRHETAACKAATSHGLLQLHLCVQVTSTSGARAEQVTGPPSPFEGLQDEDGWWANNARTHMQRLQEQEKQRATQLKHTRAWAESQVRSPWAGLCIGSFQT